MQGLTSAVKALKFIASAVKPIFIYLLVFLIIGAALLLYDNYQSLKDREKGANLSKAITLDSDCEKIAGTGEKLNLSFKFINNNLEPIRVLSFKFDKSMLEGEKGNFFKLLSTKPASLQEEESPAFEVRKFNEPILVPAKGKAEISIQLQATTRKEAGANPHTFVVYTGEVNFVLSPQIFTHTNCQLQVRYS